MSSDFLSCTSISGSKTSSYMALKYPTDKYLFTPVLTDERKWMNMFIDCSELGEIAPIPKGCKPKQIYKLISRVNRLIKRADRFREPGMMMQWYGVSSHIFEAFEQLESLGIGEEEYKELVEKYPDI